MPPTWRKEYTRYKALFLNVYRVYKNRNDVKVFLEIILSLATISFFATFALRPTALTITQLLQDIRAKQEVANSLDQKIVDLDSAQNVYQNEASRLILLDQAIPDIPNPEIFARQIQGLSVRSGATLNSLVMDDIPLYGRQSVPSGETSQLVFPQKAGEIRFAINIIGSYPSLTTFLREVENLRQPVIMDNAVINTAQATQGTILTMSINGRIPYLK